MLRSSRNILLSIMTWNIYIGAEFAPLFRATSKQIPKLVTKVFSQFRHPITRGLMQDYS